jgi:predicted transcriptional regulator
MQIGAALRAWQRPCYVARMTREQIEAIFERVRGWSAERLDDVAAVLLAMEAANEGDDLTEEDWADLEEGLAEADRGEFVSEAEMEAFFAKYR